MSAIRTKSNISDLGKSIAASIRAAFRHKGYTISKRLPRNRKSNCKRLVWSYTHQEIQAAHKMFEKFRNDGMIAHKMNGRHPVSVMSDFDPQVGEIMFLPNPTSSDDQRRQTYRLQPKCA